MSYFRITTWLVLLISCYCYYYINSIDISVPEEFRYTTGDFILKYGYGYQEHVVESDDGFVTVIYRIISPLYANSQKLASDTPILIEGGLFCSSDVLVLSGPNKDLAFILADEGFDVWLGNFRGNRYSVPGPRANHSDPNLLNYGYHEMGVYDFAASIDYIISKSESDRVNMIAVSAGCGAILALLSTRPEYNQRILKVLYFGCGMTLQTNQRAQRYAFYTLWSVPNLITSSKLLEPYPARALAMLIVCSRTFLRPICENLMKHTGFPRPFNATLGALVLTLLPSGNPMGVIDHLMQLTTSNSNEFRMRDWGPEENQRRYNSTIPPVYDVSNVTVFTRSYAAASDVLVDYKMPRAVLSQLPKHAGEMIIERGFSHSNFFINSAKSHNFLQDVLGVLYL